MNIPLELNITSNIYLLSSTKEYESANDSSNPVGAILRSLQNADNAFKCVLATDNDGIWSLNKCPLQHPGHHSVMHEFCYAIQRKWINDKVRLYLSICIFFFLIISVIQEIKYRYY